MALDMSRFVARFVEEAREHLTLLNGALLSMGKEPSDQETIYALFRSAHTIKGSAAMLKLKPIAETALHMEDALDALREGKIGYSSQLADLLSQGVDALAVQVEAAAQGTEVAPDAVLCAALDRVATAFSTPATPSAAGAMVEELRGSIALESRPGSDRRRPPPRSAF